MAKKEFSWDSEEVIGVIMEGEKVKHVIYDCMLNDVKYVSIEKWVLKKDGWTRAKNHTFKKFTFRDIAKLIG